MRLHLCAVGRLRAGPEKTLFDDYARRAARQGRGLGLGPLAVSEVEDRRGGGKTAEAALLRRALPKAARVCALDERGQQMGSVAFAKRLLHWRDNGCADLAFLIGGADGLDPALRDEADLTLSFGEMVWPHMLVRVMLAEQIYRATAILAGTPYHRA